MNSSFSLDSKEVELHFVTKENRENDTITVGDSLTSNDNNMNLKLEDSKWNTFEALKEISWLTLPTILFFMTLILMQSINLIFIRYSYDPSQSIDALYGIGISHLYLNCLIMPFIIGIVAPFEILGSNAYGSKNFSLLRIYFQRTQIISYIFTLPLFVVNFFFAVDIISYIISLFGIDDNVIKYVKEYMQLLMLIVLCNVQFSINFRFLNIVKKSYVNIIILVSILLLHPLWCYIFIIVFELGIKGAAISLIISQFLYMIVGVMYIIYFNPINESVFSYSRDSFEKWGEYLIIAFYITVMICGEMWGWEVLSIIALWIGKLDFSVHILLSNISLILYSLCIGFGMTSTIIVGRTICEKDIRVVKNYIKTILLYAISSMTFIIVILFIFKNRVLMIFTDEKDVLLKGEPIIPILCLGSIFGITQSILSSIFKGLGKHVIASLILFFNFYVTQTILGITLGKFFKMGVYGIWLTLLISVFINCVLFGFLLIFYLDFEKVKAETMKRLQSESNNNLTANNESNIQDESSVDGATIN